MLSLLRTALQCTLHYELAVMLCASISIKVKKLVDIDAICSIDPEEVGELDV